MITSIATGGVINELAWIAKYSRAWTNYPSWLISDSAKKAWGMLQFIKTWYQHWVILLYDDIVMIELKSCS